MRVTPNHSITVSSDLLHSWGSADMWLRLLAALFCMSERWLVQGPMETQVTVELRCPLPYPDCFAALIFSFFKCALSSSKHLRKPKIPDMFICYWYSFTCDGYFWAFLCCFSRRICHASWECPAAYFPHHKHKYYLLIRENMQKICSF